MKRSVVKHGWMLCLAMSPLLPAQNEPNSAEQDRILAAMHQYADQYVANLPNFLCAQTTRQLEAAIKAKRWHAGDTLVAKLSFNQGQEQRILEQVNGNPVKPGSKHWRTPLQTEGEFGILLSQVLGKESEAFFQWSRWEDVFGRRLAVFDFTVDKEHSTLILRRSDLAKAVIPYSGSVYADPANGAVWRISDMASDIPAALDTRQIGTTVDYAEIAIGDRTYLLPTQATVSLLFESRKIRNEITFTNYRKFTADSVIQFDSGDHATPK